MKRIDTLFICGDEPKRGATMALIRLLEKLSIVRVLEMVYVTTTNYTMGAS